jgi:hypothetical protein
VVVEVPTTSSAIGAVKVINIYSRLNVLHPSTRERMGLNTVLVLTDLTLDNKLHVFTL